MAQHLPITPVLIEDFALMLRTLGGGNQVGHDHLEVMASLKRLEKAVKKAASELLPYANAEFEKVGGEMTLESGAVVKQYTKPGKWVFPAHIQERDDELTALKNAAKKDGSARQEEVEIDPAKDRTFSISAAVNINKVDMLDLIDASETLLKRAPDPAAPSA